MLVHLFTVPEVKINPYQPSTLPLPVSIGNLPETYFRGGRQVTSTTAPGYQRLPPSILQIPSVPRKRTQAQRCSLGDGLVTSSRSWNAKPGEKWWLGSWSRKVTESVDTNNQKTTLVHIVGSKYVEITGQLMKLVICAGKPSRFGQSTRAWAIPAQYWHPHGSVLYMVYLCPRIMFE